MTDTILIVDDEIIVTETLSMLIRITLSKQVITYNDPRQALNDERLRENQVDLVISDFLMPGMNGLEFLQLVKNVTPETVAILLTGYADKENAIRGINQIGLYHYVEKPWDNDDLIKTIQNGLEKKSLSDQLHGKIMELNRINRDLEQTVAKRTSAIRNLLDNAGQGFLSFGKDLLIDENYSRQCRNIFQEEIEGRTFPALLAPFDSEPTDFLQKLIGKIFGETDPDQRELLLSLLPNELQILGRDVNLEYKIIDDSTETRQEVIMVILTDITDRRKLEAQMEKEEHVLRIVAKAAADPSLFFQCIDEYRDFFMAGIARLLQSGRGPQQISNEILRSVHTLKGCFGQWGMTFLAERLHELENIVSNYANDDTDLPNPDLAVLLGDFPTDEWLDDELCQLRRILGDEFFRRRDLLEIEQIRIDQLKERIFRILPPHQYRALLPEVEQLRYSPFKKLLQAYPESTVQLAQECEKLVLPFEITGGEFLADTRRYSPFCRSLIHVFRNMIYHGIESPDERVEVGKLESGLIQCDVSLADEEIVITLSDDGHGIDTERLRERVVDKGLLTKEDADKISDDGILDYIFAENLSTLGRVNHLAGRGIGLSAVKSELKKLDGSIKIHNIVGSGTRFEFHLPLRRAFPLSPSILPSIMNTLSNDIAVILTKLLEKPLSVEMIPYQGCIDALPLLENTGFIPMKGAIRGGLIVSMGKPLAHHLARAMAQTELTGGEIEDSALDAVVECANILLGQVIRDLPENETLIMDSPWKIQAEKALIHNPDLQIKGLQIRFAAGLMEVFFLMEQDPDQPENFF